MPAPFTDFPCSYSRRTDGPMPCNASARGLNGTHVQAAFSHQVWETLMPAVTKIAAVGRVPGNLEGQFFCSADDCTAIWGAELLSSCY